MVKDNQKVIIIGCGIAGLAAAMQLSKTGLEVEVHEKATTPGGKLRAINSSMGPIDAGPTVFTLKPWFDEFFSELGERFDDHVTISEQSVLARHWWPDESRLDLRTDLHETLSAIKEFSPKTKFYFAASSEIFGNPRKSPQNENTQFNPRSAYGISKLAGYHLTKNYREAHGLFACSGILYNHESPRRGDFFVTKKIAKAAARIKKRLDKKIYLGNVNAKRDWGYSKDYVKYMWKSLQLKKPQDFVLGTGKLHSVKDFLKIAFERVGLNYQKYLVIDKKYYRKENKISLVADNYFAKRKLKFKPSKSFKEIVHEMVDFELEKLNNN